MLEDENRSSVGYNEEMFEGDAPSDEPLSAAPARPAGQDPAALLQRQLAPGEQLVWWGQPKKLHGPRGGMQKLFAVVFLAFACFWEVSALQALFVGGVFGVMTSYNDNFTMKGELTSNGGTDHSVDVTVNKGGSYGVVAGQDATVGKLDFAEGAGITVVAADGDVLKQAYESQNGVTGSVTAADGLTGADVAVVDPDYAFFDTTIEVNAEGNRIDATLSRSENTAASYASGHNQAELAGALMANADSAVFTEMLGATKDQVRSTLDSLSNDFHLAAQNATIVNTALMGRMIKDQANAYGEAQRAELEAKIAAELKAAEDRAAKLAEIGTVTILAKAGDEGKLFGSIGTRDIADALTAAGCEIHKSEVRLPEGVLRSVGEYEIALQLHADVKSVIKLVIAADK